MNKLTDGSNMLWESSRMILPEHKERIRIRLEEARRGGKRERQQLDEQEAERINEAIMRSLHDRAEKLYTIAKGRTRMAAFFFPLRMILAGFVSVMSYSLIPNVFLLQAAPCWSGRHCG